MSKKYEIFKEERISEQDGLPFIFYQVRGIVRKQEDLPRTERGWVVYPDLKLCPFCGGNPKIKAKSKTMIKGKLTRNYYVYCSRCDSRGSRFIPEDFNDDVVQTKLEAINAWNSRYEALFSEYDKEYTCGQGH